MAADRGGLHDTASGLASRRHLSGGSTAVYVDGTLVDEVTIEPGPIEHWNPEFPLLVGNEATLDRPFIGDVFSVAVYGRALARQEIGQNYQAGPIG